MKKAVRKNTNVGAQIENINLNGAFGNETVDFSRKNTRGWVIQDRGFWEIGFDYKHPLPDYLQSKHDFKNKSFSSEKETIDALKALFRDFK